MKGRDAVFAIRELGFEGIIIGVTANVLQSETNDFLARGADHVIHKPMNTEKFIAAVAEIVRKKALLSS